MPALKIHQFGGMLPAWDAHLLPDGQAATSTNGYLFSGALQGWRKPKLLRALTNSAARSVYRIPIISETQAIAYLVFKVNVTAGDTVKVGEQLYTWRSAITSTSAPYDVLIGATPAISATNLLAALTADNETNVNSGILYGDGTVQNPDILIYVAGSPARPGLSGPSTGTVAISSTNYTYLFVGSVDFGAAYNTVAVTESTSRVRTTWLKDLLSFSDTTSTFTGGTNPTFPPSITSAATWLEFLDQDTNVLKSPIVDDQFKRFYFASPSTVPQYNTYERIVAGQPNWLLGVPAPGCPPVVTVSGGGSTLSLGNLTSSGVSQWTLANAVYLTQITTGGSTILSDLVFVGTIADTGAIFQGVLYADNGTDSPGDLIAFGQVVVGVVAGNNTSTFLNPPTLDSQTKYWIGFATDSSIQVQGSPNDNALPHDNVAMFINTFSNGPAAEAQGVILGEPGIQMFIDCNTDDVLEARAYTYTWVSAYNEEGPPAPPTLVNGWSNGVWTVGLWEPPSDDVGVLRNLKSINIYRTVSGASGQTVYYFVANVPIGTVSYTDVIPDNTVALNLQLPSTTWYPPPENLQGLTALPNGMMAGFVSNQIWFCVPYFPHAWPPAFVLTTDYPIVGLGVTSGALVVCTGATPYVVNGISPGNMSMSKCSEPNPCLSRASILSGDAAVSFMSPNGLIQVTAQGQAVNTTALWITRERWQQLTPQLYPRAVYLASCYFVMGSVSPDGTDTSEAQEGFTIELDQDNSSFSIWPQPGGHRLGFNVLTSPDEFDIENVLTDPWTGIGLLVQDSSVYYYDFSDPLPEMVPYTWSSKIYQQNTRKSYEAMRVWFTVPTNTPAQSAVRNEKPANDTSWLTLGTGQYGILRTYVDVDGTGNLTLIDCREIRKSGELLRIISGFKAEQWQWEITGRVIISNVQVATSAKELANV